MYIDQKRPKVIFIKFIVNDEEENSDKYLFEADRSLTFRKHIRKKLLLPQYKHLDISYLKRNFGKCLVVLGFFSAARITI